MNTIEIELDCQHRVRIPANSSRGVGDTAYCRFHGYQRITYTWPKEWRVICSECSFGKWVGQLESRAKRVAREHKHRGKCITVYDRITASGGTSRKKLLKEHLTPTTTAAKFDPNEPIPF